MSTTSILGGLAEAAMLVLVARIAFALASDSSNVTLNVGPITNWVVSVPILIGIAAALVVVRMAFQALQTVLAAARDVRDGRPGPEVVDPSVPRRELGAPGAAA